MVKDTSVTAQFKIVKNDLSDFLFENSEDVFLLAWTTTMDTSSNIIGSW